MATSSTKIKSLTKRCSTLLLDDNFTHNLVYANGEKTLVQDQSIIHMGKIDIPYHTLQQSTSARLAINLITFVGIPLSLTNSEWFIMHEVECRIDVNVGYSIQRLRTISSVSSAALTKISPHQLPHYPPWTFCFQMQLLGVFFFFFPTG